MDAICDEKVDVRNGVETSHKFVATYDKIAAVCNEIVVIRDKICGCIYDDMNQARTPSSASSYYLR
jgi:predicted adenine nucleotide alpha hydrolase (AANH) superfamily ATPase